VKKELKKPLGGHFEFPIFTNFLRRHPVTYTNPYAKFQKNPSTFATFRARTIKGNGLRHGGGGGGRGGGMTTKP